MKDKIFSLYEPLTAEQVFLMYKAFKDQNSFKPLVECRLFYTICYVICDTSLKEAFDASSSTSKYCKFA